MANKAANINNYPILGDYDFDPGWSNKKQEFCFTGGISRERGIIPLMEATGNLDYTFNLVGRFATKALYEQVKAMPGWEKVNEVGWVDRAEVNHYLRKSMVGLLNVFHIPNAEGSQPNKLNFLLKKSKKVPSLLPISKILLLGLSLYLFIKFKAFIFK